MGFFDRDMENVQDSEIKDKQEFNRRQERMQRKISKPLLPSLINMALVLFILWTVIALLLDLFVNKTATTKEIVKSVLLAAVCLGLPTVALCGVQLYLIKAGKTDADKKLYIIYIVFIAAIIISLLFLFLFI